MAGADSICLCFIQTPLRHNLHNFPNFLSPVSICPERSLGKSLGEGRLAWWLSHWIRNSGLYPSTAMSLMQYLGTSFQFSVSFPLPFPHTDTSGSFILLENSSRHRLLLMSLGTRQGSTIAGLDVGFRYACNINDNNLKPICAKVIF